MDQSHTPKFFCNMKPSSAWRLVYVDVFKHEEKI